jgi:S-methylmethionine-dependent homocysteine/selenocysteine methylase
MVWRASPDWLARLGYGAADWVRLNTRAVDRTRAALDTWRSRRGAFDTPILLSADIGPRGDGYRVDAVSTSPEAGFDYHREQVGILARAGVDVVQALTMTHVNEAIGVVLAAREHGLPVIVSPTVETDGRVPDGTPLGDFIHQVDEATAGAPLYYMVNCAHPTHVLPTLRAARDSQADWLTRFRGFRANASQQSHQELDESPTLDIGDPEALGAQLAGMRREFGLAVVGGCCGTDARHIAAIARSTAVS